MSDVTYSAVKTSVDTITIFEGVKEVFRLDKITYLSDLSNIAFYVVCSDLGRPVIYGVNKGFSRVCSQDIFNTPTARIHEGMSSHDDLVLWEHIRALEVSNEGKMLQLIAPYHGKAIRLLSIDSEQVKLNLFGVKARFKLSDNAVAMPWADELMSTLLWIAARGFGYHQEISKGLITAIDSTDKIQWDNIPTTKSVSDKYKRIAGVKNERN